MHTGRKKQTRELFITVTYHQGKLLPSTTSRDLAQDTCPFTGVQDCFDRRCPVDAP